MTGDLLYRFVAESNRIEGIVRDPTPRELEATERFLLLARINRDSMCDLAAVYAGELGVLRSKRGMNVRVGKYIAPEGGIQVAYSLADILRRASAGRNGGRTIHSPERECTPWAVHCAYETLHPFMDGNGRTGRALWLWMMNPHLRFELSFLHWFYYQTLGETRK